MPFSALRALTWGAVVILAGCGNLDDAGGSANGGLVALVDGGNGGGTGGGGGGTAETSCQGSRPACLYDTIPTCVNGHWECPFTPLVLAFDAQPVRFTSGDARFDLTGSGAPVSSDWPSAETPWLALDRNRNGTIDGAAELFGSAVRLANGRLAANGFEALAELDDNHDGRIDAKDRRFHDLAVWADRDDDRKTGPGELTRAVTGLRRLVSISLAYRVAPACDDRGNCAAERAAFTWADPRGTLHRAEVVDVHLPVRPGVRLATR